MKRITYFAMCLCTMLLVLASCSKSSNSNSSSSDNPLVGKWQQEVDKAGVQATVTYDFKSDGTLTQTSVMNSESPYMAIEGEGTCDYTFNDNTITFTISAENYNFTKYEVEGIPEEQIELAMEQQKSQMTGIEQSLTDVVIDGDILTANFNGQEITLTRI